MVQSVLRQRQYKAHTDAFYHHSQSGKAHTANALEQRHEHGMVSLFLMLTAHHFDFNGRDTRQH